MLFSNPTIYIIECIRWTKKYVITISGFCISKVNTPTIYDTRDEISLQQRHSKPGDKCGPAGVFSSCTTLRST